MTEKDKGKRKVCKILMKFFTRHLYRWEHRPSDRYMSLSVITPSLSGVSQEKKFTIMIMIIEIDFNNFYLTKEMFR